MEPAYHYAPQDTSSIMVNAIRIVNKMKNGKTINVSVFNLIKEIIKASAPFTVHLDPNNKMANVYLCALQDISSIMDNAIWTVNRMKNGMVINVYVFNLIKETIMVYVLFIVPLVKSY